MNNPIKEFKPDINSFDIQWASSWMQDRVKLKSFRITSEHIAGKPVRVYGIVGFPDDSEKYPAILHIHGGGGTVSPDDVVEYVKRGYACMSFDWTGPFGDRKNSEVTHFPKEFHRCDAEIYDDLDIGNIKIACAVKAARCCLALLASFDNVDQDNIGFYGISWGGFAAWLLNGTDATAKCAVSVYGTGGLHQPGHIFNQYWLKASDQQKKNWMTVVEPRNYMDSQNAPFLHLNATNDFFGGFDIAADMLPMINNDWRCDYSPNCNHSYDDSSQVLMYHWFDYYLKGIGSIPEAPEIKVERKDTDTILVKTWGDPCKSTLYYSCGNSWQLARCWNSVNDWQEVTDGYQIELKLNGETWLYARKQFDNGMTMSSTPLCLHQKTIMSEKSNALFVPEAREGGWGQLGKLGFNNGCLELPEEEDAFTGLNFFGPSNPECKADESYDKLNIEIEGIQSLTINARHADVDNWNIVYTTTIDEINESKITINKENFKHPDLGSLRSFADIAVLTFSGKTTSNKPAKINTLFWS